MMSKKKYIFEGVTEDSSFANAKHAAPSSHLSLFRRSYRKLGGSRKAVHGFHFIFFVVVGPNVNRSTAHVNVCAWAPQHNVAYVDMNTACRSGSVLFLTHWEIRTVRKAVFFLLLLLLLLSCFRSQLCVVWEKKHTNEFVF